MFKKGDKFNFLTAIKFDHRDKWGCQYWLFSCECGNEKIIRTNSVKSGKAKACGCLHKNCRGKIKHGMNRTGIYRIWSGMKQRCLNKKNPDYKHYGGRGITICPEWLNSFINFYKDMGDRPENKSLDRINNDLGYCKSNCKWSTQKEQCNNKRTNLNKK